MDTVIPELIITKNGKNFKALKYISDINNGGVH